MHLILLLFIFHLFFLIAFFPSLLYYSGVSLVYFTFGSALSCYYYPIFLFSFLFLLLTHTEYILPLTFNPSSGRKKDSECRTKQWGKGKKNIGAYYYILYIAFIGWDRLSLVWIFQMFDLILR